MALENKTILITGGLGQVGISLIQHLQAKYATPTIHVLDLKIPLSDSVQNIHKVTYHAGNITDQSAVSEIFEHVKPDIVFHTAGLIPQIAQRLGMDNEESYMKVNFEGTKIVLEESRRVGVKALVYTSSADVVKGNSWQDLKGVNEDFPVPAVFDGAYAKSKVRFLFFVLIAPSSPF
jgi:sterol-4alpha-carboxylate 3-dehydrogenase (decarboxylating)